MAVSNVFSEQIYMYIRIDCNVSDIYQRVNHHSQSHSRFNLCHNTPAPSFSTLPSPVTGPVCGAHVQLYPSPPAVHECIGLSASQTKQDGELLFWDCVSSSVFHRVCAIRVSKHLQYVM